MPKFYILSDIHGFYDEMIEALNEANFNPETDFLISLGDEMDRGPYPEKVINYLMSLPNAVFVRGNHTDLMKELLKKKYPDKYDYSNGTFQSVLDLAPNAKTFEEACIVAEQKVKPFFEKEVNYFESANYIFVHSFIPLINKDGLPMYYTRNRKFEFNPDWRYAHASEWEEARWGNPFLLAEQGFLPDKTLVFGHWATEHKWAEVEGRKDFDDNAHFDIYRGDGFIGIDACTAYSGKVNILVLEDNFLEKSLDKS